MKFVIYLLVIFMLAQTADAQFCSSRLPQSPLSECDYCIASQGVSPLEAGSSGIRWDIRSLYLGRPYSGTIKQPSDGESESYLTNQFTGFYRITNALTAVVMVPYTIRSANEPMMSGDRTIAAARSKGSVQDVVTNVDTTFHQVRSSGLGDIIAMMRYTLIKFSASSAEDEMISTGSSAMTIISFSGGVKLPTGRTDFMSDGEYLDSHLQPGSGSTDIVLGTSLLWSLDRTTIATNILGSFPGTGARGHRFGNYINADLTGRYRILASEDNFSTLAVTLGLCGELRSHETQDGTLVDDSGGSVLYLSPGIQWIASERISFEASYHLPIYHYLGGTQLGESYRMMGGIQYLF